MNTFLPIFTSPLIIEGGKSIFYQIDKKVIVEAPKDLIEALVKICDGTRSVDEIIEVLSQDWSRGSLEELMKELEQQKVLVNSRHLNNSFWKSIENPSYFFPADIIDNENIIKKSKYRHEKVYVEEEHKISDFFVKKLLQKRHSVRSFSGGLVPFQDIIDMIWSAYGEVKRSNSKKYSPRTVPSAGALYPLVLHVVIFQEVEDLSSGVYRSHLHKPNSVGFNLLSKDTDAFLRSFLDPDMLNKTHGVIVVSGSLKITGEKYGNRSMLYVPLEAGHVAQNIFLAAAEKNIATLEIGGFMEKLLSESIGLTEEYVPLTTIAFGYEKPKVEKKETDVEVEIDWVIPIAGNYMPQFSIAMARVSKEINKDWSYGRSPSPKLAKIKAISEAKEWAACGCVPKNLTKASFLDLQEVVDPRKVIKFHSEQYDLKGFPFERFDEKEEYEWVEAYDKLSGSSKYVFADHVYFPYFPDTPAYTYANSSGVAAHPNKMKAIKLSTLELIERDSFMIHYLTKMNSPEVLHATLPDYIQNRIRKLQKMGFRVWIKDHSLGFAPTVFVFVQNENLFYSSCASSSSFNIEKAVSHALTEVEASVLARLQNGPVSFISPKEVKMPFDHGAVYEQEDFFRKADFLISSNKVVSFKSIGERAVGSWGEMINKMRKKGWSLLTVPLSLFEKYGGNGNLHIVRSIIPGLVPMTFGYRQEPGGMKRIYKVANKFGDSNVTYQDLIKFPHPFA